MAGLEGPLITPIHEAQCLCRPSRMAKRSEARDPFDRHEASKLSKCVQMRQPIITSGSHGYIPSRASGMTAATLNIDGRLVAADIN